MHGVCVTLSIGKEETEKYGSARGRKKTRKRQKRTGVVAERVGSGGRVHREQLGAERAVARVDRQSALVEARVEHRHVVLRFERRRPYRRHLPVVKASALFNVLSHCTHCIVLKSNADPEPDAMKCDEMR